MSYSHYGSGKRARAMAKAAKKKAKRERRMRKRDEGPAEVEIVSAEEVLGVIPTIDEAMQNLPVPDPNAPVDRSAKTIPVRLFVGRLSWDTTVQSLRRCFEKFGTVLDAVVAQDHHTGRSRGFGFVELADRKNATRAINALDGAALDGRQIVVNIATERGRRPAHA